MRGKLIIIPLAALGILVGLGLVAAQEDDPQDATVPYEGAGWRHCWDGQSEVDCDEAFP